MRINEHVALSSSSVILVPYCQHHVPTYHDWMKDPDIQAATASEQLSLEEEYDMQQSWRTDVDKLTFIICLPFAISSSGSNHTAEIASMIGDVNMFIAYCEETDESVALVGELELMIATRNFQRKGFGRAALLSFLTYIYQHESEIVETFTEQNAQSKPTTRFDYLTAKIGESNEKSLRLFESLGFRKTGNSPNYFGEFELRLERLSMESITKHMIEHNINDFEEVEYQTSVNPGLPSVTVT